MNACREKTVRARDPERGAALVVALIATAGLVSIGGLSVMAARTELRAAAQARFNKTALYAAESGAAAAMDFLRTDCSPDGSFFTQFMNAPTAAPQMPSGIPGNNVQPGQTFNPFQQGGAMYQVFIQNNENDPGYASALDQDGRVVLRAVGHGPNDTRVVLEIEVMAETCINTFCAIDYAQKNVSQRNDAVTVCSTRIDTAGSYRTINLAGAN